MFTWKLSSHYIKKLLSQVFCGMAAVKYFTKFTGNHICYSCQQRYLKQDSGTSGFL